MRIPAIRTIISRHWSTNPTMNIHLSLLFLMVLSVEAQSPNPQVPSGDVVTSFQPSLAVVVGVLAIMFTLTFVLLLFAKCCQRRSNPNEDPELGRSRSRFSGIDKTVIESLPFFRFSSLRGSRAGLECAVCLSKFQDIEVLRLLPKCKHAFHIDCVDQWLEKHSSCPLCRHRVSTDDLALVTYSSSLRFLQSQSDLRQDSNIELFVQREEDNHQGSSRFSHGSSFRRTKEEELPIQESLENSEEESLHKHNHQIIVSDAVLKNRWSSVSSSDLMFLNSEMINATSSDRFTYKDSNLLIVNEDAEVMKIKEEIEKKRLFESRISKFNQTGTTPSEGLSGNTSKILDPNEKRSMSEIIVHSRFPEFDIGSRTAESSSSENINAKLERQRKLWLPIARNTVQWFANRDTRSPNFQNTRQTLDV